MRRTLIFVALVDMICMFLSYNYKQGIESIAVSGFSMIYLMLLSFHFKE